MNPRHLPYRPSSHLARLLAAVAAPVLTLALFGAVALGLTDDGSWSAFALEAGSATASSSAA